MVLLGIDPHKDTHTAVAVDQAGRQLGQLTVAARTLGHAELLGWARHCWPDERRWAVEDCRHVTGRLERDLLAAGERVVRVPPRLMAGARQAVRALGKSDPIDALAVARAALREPDLPTAGHDQASWEVKLLVDHREHLIAERTRTINRLRWHLHQLDPDLEHATRRLLGPSLVLADHGMRLQVPLLMGPVVDPLVPTKEPQEPTTVTPAEIIYHRRVQVLDRAGQTSVTQACRTFGVSRTT